MLTHHRRPLHAVYLEAFLLLTLHICENGCVYSEAGVGIVGLAVLTMVIPSPYRCNHLEALPLIYAAIPMTQEAIVKYLCTHYQTMPYQRSLTLQPLPSPRTPSSSCHQDSTPCDTRCRRCPLRWSHQKRILWCDSSHRGSLPDPSFLVCIDRRVGVRVGMAR